MLKLWKEGDQSWVVSWIQDKVLLTDRLVAKHVQVSFSSMHRLQVLIKYSMFVILQFISIFYTANRIQLTIQIKY